MLARDNALLMIVDVQGKLALLMHEKETLFRNLQILIKGAQILNLPIVWVEQNPAGLGPTIPEIANLLANQKPLPKMTFSACGDAAVIDAVRRLGRSQVLLAGIEAHVCIYQTAADLLAQGFEVEVVADAVSSRLASNKQVGLGKVAALHGGLTCTETALFELMGHAAGPEFKELVRLLK
ncbi:MAG: isochorismatase family protein [Verrucomicrobiia bacterium]